MATKPHATTEEQTAHLGRVRRKPRYVDMFSGEVSETPPKRGNGSHIALKPLGIERPAVPGMASWAGGGPDGMRCKDCVYLGGVTVVRPSGERENSAAACAQYAKRTGHLPSVRYDITLCSACDQFKAETPGERKLWRIDAAGNLERA